MNTEIDSVTRRHFLRAITAAGAFTLSESTRADEPSVHEKAVALLKPGSETIVILLYPGFTALDAIGPHYALSGMAGASVRFIAATTDAVASESGFSVSPHLSFDQCPENIDLLLIPGGMAGTITAMEDEATMAFVKKAAARSKMIGSICTGALILGAAGLIRGYKATSHWQTMDLLPIVGATPVKERVVIDRNLVTCGGVTAGLDMGFTLVRRYRGDLYAKRIQLLAEYDPQPPFPKSGNPDTAEPEVVALLNHMHADYISGWGKKLQNTPGAKKDQ
jgi:putative intracellular protease/amidase